LACRPAVSELGAAPNRRGRAIGGTTAKRGSGLSSAHESPPRRRARLGRLVSDDAAAPVEFGFELQARRGARRPRFHTGVVSEHHSEIAQRRRCDLESTLVVDDAPLSKWQQIDSFETLSRCQGADAPYAPTDEENQASLAKLLEPAWGKDARTTAFTMLEAAVNQKMHKRCIASDDPRLKGN
jgi:hypothetical protein